MQNIIKKLKLKRRMIAKLAALHFYGNPSKKLKIIGVTGTNGKTTTATLLYKMATSLGYKTGLIGTVENIILDERMPATHTTPGPIELNKLLSQMAKKGCEYVFMEVSSHAIDQNRIAGIHFTGGVFTNLTHDHLDYHKSIENYFLAKKKFFDYLPDDAFALTNTDDEHGVLMIADTKAKKYTYGFTDAEDFHSHIEKIDFSGINLDINGEKIQSHLLGKFNAYNLLSVISVAQILKFDLVKLKEIIKNIEPPRGRFDHFLSNNGVLCIVDFAHTPDALEKIISAVREIKNEKSKLITVFGCGGDRDPLKRRIMGKIGATLSDSAIFTADNPRSEDVEKIIAEMKTDLTMAEIKKISSVSDRKKAIRKAVSMAKEGDVILCAGKGHETYQEIKGVKHHFNDLEELKNSFK